MGGAYGSILQCSCCANSCCRVVWQFAKQVQLPPLIASSFLFVVASILCYEVGDETYGQLLAGTVSALACYLGFALIVTLETEERSWLVKKLKTIQAKCMGVST